MSNKIYEFVSNQMKLLVVNNLMLKINMSL